MILPLFKAFAAIMLGASTASSQVVVVLRRSMHSFESDFPTYVMDPTPKPSSPCTGNTPDWSDLYGDGCSWYEMNDRPGCPLHGDFYGGEMGVANDHCCYCEGTGAPVVSPSPTPHPTLEPTITRPPATPYPTYDWNSRGWTPFPTEAMGPTPKPTPPCTGSTEGWVDSYGDGCEWYEAFDSEGCPEYGDDYDGGMGVANEHCCYCAGTGAPMTTPSPTAYSTYTL